MSPREFALEVTQRLQQAGFQALWAGGCVRDQMLGKEPKDYDVATNATPSQISETFGDRKTLELGVAFGVITVIGTKESGNIEVATFRSDADYSDGRRPDSVQFSTAEMDAQRRDFTINGLFLDPIRDQIIDYVGGKNDLQAGLVRAIGDPAQRIAEDKLRMLRAVRFAANLDFQLDDATKATIQRHAHEIHVVSVERMAVELSRMLVNEHRRRAVELLIETGLLENILPELKSWQDDSVARDQVLTQLAALVDPGFAVALAALLEKSVSVKEFKRLGKRLKLPNQVIDHGAWILKHASTLADAHEKPWSEIQPLLIQPEVQDAICFMKARSADRNSIEFMNERLSWPPEKLNPAPLLNGDTLRDLGVEVGPIYAEILTKTRNQQLNGQISTQAEAIALAKQWAGLGSQ